MPRGVYIRTAEHRQLMASIQTGKKASDETKQKLSEMRKGKPNPHVGIPRTEETKIKIGNAGRGKKHPPRSDESRKRISEAQKKRFQTQDVWNKGLEWIEKRGENHHNWNGGSGTERHQAMGKIEYKNWRTSVFERDNYTCQECNERGGELQADHIKPWALYPELRYELNNGRTLCIDCHRKTDTWGYKTAQLRQIN